MHNLKYCPLQLMKGKKKERLSVIYIMNISAVSKKTQVELCLSKVEVVLGRTCACFEKS